MIDKVFPVTGNKIVSLITDENSLKFFNKEFDTVSGFQADWNKKFSFSKKVEIEYAHIRSVSKEDNNKIISIKHSAWAGIPDSLDFSFVNSYDYDIFFRFLEKERYFKRIRETMTAARAARGWAIGAIAAIGLTIFAYQEAVTATIDEIEQTSSSKLKLLRTLIGFLGGKGVIIAGALIACFLVYRAWLRYANPPDRTVFLPPNA